MGTGKSKASNKKPQKKHLLENDYERMIPEYHRGNIIYGEHLVRYLSAQKLVEGKTVLDIACGSGYGTASLAATAKHVIGVDVSKDAVEYAKENYSLKNTEYLSSDGKNIPLPDNSVDIVVSFETIEHIEDYEFFMAEVERCLKPDGLFVLSTPNDKEFAEGNHFHIHQFVHDELERLVRKHFKYIKDYYQVDWIYSGIHTEGDITHDKTIKIDLMNVSPIEMDKVLYFFMLCSNRKINETINSFGSVAQHWSERSNQHKESLTSQHLSNIEDVSEDRLRYIRKLEEDIAIYQNQLKWLQSATNNPIGRLLLKLKRKSR